MVQNQWGDIKTTTSYYVYRFNILLGDVPVVLSFLTIQLSVQFHSVDASTKYRAIFQEETVPASFDILLMACTSCCCCFLFKSFSSSSKLLPCKYFLKRD